MRSRYLAIWLALSCVAGALAQDAPLAPDGDAKLVFGAGDRPQLLAIGSSRAITYAPAAATGAMQVAKVVTFGADTEVQSTTSDGRTALIVTRKTGEKPKMFLLDTATGKQQDLPLGWYGATQDAVGSISGDGSFVSIYSGDNPMKITVYAWPAKTVVATRTSAIIAAGGSFSGGLTEDGVVEFVNNRVGHKVVTLTNGSLIGMFGTDSVRSPDGSWVVDFPDRNWNDAAHKDVLLYNGKTGKATARMAIQVPEDQTYGQLRGAFCGSTGRFIVASARGVAAYAIPSGGLLATFPDASWRDSKAGNMDPVSVACSASGTRMAILSGTRLTLHNLK